MQFYQESMRDKEFPRVLSRMSRTFEVNGRSWEKTRLCQISGKNELLYKDGSTHMQISRCITVSLAFFLDESILDTIVLIETIASPHVKQRGDSVPGAEVLRSKKNF